MSNHPNARILGCTIVLIVAFCAMVLVVFGCAAAEQAALAGFTSQQKADLKTAVSEAVLNNAIVGTGRDVNVDTGGLIGTIQAVSIGLLLLTYPAGKFIWLFFGGARRRLSKQ